MAQKPERIDLPRIDRTIGDHDYRCSRLLLNNWIELEVLATSILGHQVLDLDENNLGSIAPKLLQGSNTRDHEALITLLGKSLQVHDRGSWTQLTRDKQQRWWACNIRELAATIELFFEVQFADFFRGLELLSSMPANEQADQEGKAIDDRDESQNT